MPESKPQPATNPGGGNPGTPPYSIGGDPGTPPHSPRAASPQSDAVVCERCGEEMFRMHAVWRCPNCGFKTDCCGW